MWTMPEWMEKCRPSIRDTGGNPIEELINDKETSPSINLPRYILICCVSAQIELLEDLHKKGLLQ